MKFKSFLLKSHLKNMKKEKQELDSQASQPLIQNENLSLHQRET